MDPCEEQILKLFEALIESFPNMPSEHTLREICPGGQTDKLLETSNVLRRITDALRTSGRGKELKTEISSAFPHIPEIADKVLNLWYARKNEIDRKLINDAQDVSLHKMRGVSIQSQLDLRLSELGSSIGAIMSLRVDQNTSTCNFGIRMDKSDLTKFLTCLDSIQQQVDELS